MVFSETSNPTALVNEIYVNGNFFQRNAIASYVNDASFAYGALNTTKTFPADAFFGAAQANRGILTRDDIVIIATGEFARWGWIGAKRPVHFDFIGDSITLGLSLANIPLMTHPYKIAQTMVAKTEVDGSRRYPSVSLINYGVSGTRTTQMLASNIATTGSGVYASGGAFTKFANRACRQICSINGGTNNIVLSGESPETAYENLRLLVAGAGASGKYNQIAVWTSLPRYDNATLTPWTSTLFAYNDLIRTGMADSGSLRAAGATHLIDVQTLTEFNNTNLPMTTGVPGAGSFINNNGSPFTTQLFVANGAPSNGFPTDSVHPAEYSNGLMANLFITAMGL